MSRGFNSETDPRLLPPGNFSIFKNLSLRGGAIRPRAADAPYLPEPGSTEAFLLEQTGQAALAEVYDLGRDGGQAPLWAVAPFAGGEVRIHEVATGRSEALALPAPLTPRFCYFWRALGDNALLPGQSRAYAAAWRTPLGFESGLSGVFKIENDAHYFVYGSLTGNAPSWGQTLTNATLGQTLIAHGVEENPYTPDNGTVVFRLSEKSSSQDWMQGHSLSWEGGSATLLSGEMSCNVHPAFGAPQDPPPDATAWTLYALEEETGLWREVSRPLLDGGYPLEGTRVDNSAFPYRNLDQVEELVPYDGPLDLSGLPEALVSSLDGAQALAAHRGCLFVARGAQVLYSEPFGPRWFRSWASLNAGAGVLALVSRGAVVEVYTEASVLEIRGDAPNFELVDLGIRQGPVAPASVAVADDATFALFADGLYAYEGASLRNLTAGLHDGWLQTMIQPALAVAGTRLGVYYLVFPDGQALCYDWREDEWFYRSFSAGARGFCPLPRELGAALKEEGGGALLPEGGQGAVDWALEWPGGGDGLSRPAPGRVFLDAEGEIYVDLRVDGDSAGRFPAPRTPGFLRLPRARGRRWAVRLDGSGSSSDTLIRGVRHE